MGRNKYLETRTVARFNASRALLTAGMALGLPEAMEMLNLVPPPIRQQRRSERKTWVGRTQNLIADRSSNIQKLQRSPIELMQPNEKAKLRHAWYRKEKAAAAPRDYLIYSPPDGPMEDWSHKLQEQFGTSTEPVG